ncbi:ABC transporter permease, partial [Bifidobacterium pseudocatenulatum]|nr:ABC transporter permease [Bifidobacterium pseudocatenulatum]
MVVTVDGGENFAISGGKNTFYFHSLWAGYSLTQTVPKQVLSSAKNGAQGIDINYKYEYVDGGPRNSKPSDIKI